MQYDTALQDTALQPFIRLAQSNMELVSRFALSPEVTSEAMRAMQSCMEQASALAAAFIQSRAFAELAQGLIRNQTEFVTDLSQSAYAVMGQAQATLLQHAQEATSNVIDVATARATRGRQAA